MQNNLFSGKYIATVMNGNYITYYRQPYCIVNDHYYCISYVAAYMLSLIRSCLCSLYCDSFSIALYL